MSSVKAENRSLRDWFALIRTGKINLPRFQRREAWGETEIVALLDTILRGLPAGATLTLQVGDKQQFPGRPIVGAPNSVPPIAEQLLDGQQRLTALWRSLKDNYPDRTFFIGFERDEFGVPRRETATAFDQARYFKSERRYPLWADDPKKCWQEKNAIPVRLLDPDEDVYSEWVDEALPNGTREQTRALEKIIQDLRVTFTFFNLPFLALPNTTEPRVALDVFVKMNTSFIKLSSFDISVAYMEAVAGVPLHDKLADLEKSLPTLKRFDFVQDLILDVAAHRCGLTPGVAGYRKIDWKKIADEWDTLTAGIAGVLELLEQEKIFDTARLPSYPPLPVIAALWEHRGHADAEGRARALFKRYLWHAFLSDRYQRNSATNAVTDIRGLRKTLTTGADVASAPIFNTASHPLATVDAIAIAGWPKEKNILGRALLALQLQCGAVDFADGSIATAANVSKREYHHLFPAAMLESVQIADDQVWRAVNCALITWKTNRKLSDQDPLVYLQKRTEHALNGETEVRARLRSHIVHYPHLTVGPYALLAADDRAATIRSDYERFCRSRAELLHIAATKAAAGDLVTADSVSHSWEQTRQTENNPL